MTTQLNPERRQRLVLVLIVVALGAFCLASPILMFLIKFGWPRIRELFQGGMEDLEAPDH